jgi:vancomycin resistance protein YoaR
LIRKLLLVLMFAAAAIAGGFLLGDYLYTSQRFPSLTYIESIDVSQLSIREAVQLLEDAHIDNVCLKPVRLISSNEVHEYSPSDIGAYIKPRETVYRAFRLSYENNYLKSLLKRALNEEGRRVYTLGLGLDEGVVRAVLKEVAGTIDSPSEEARLILKGGGKWTITNEKIGRAVDMDETISLLKEAFSAGQRTSILVVKEMSPRILKKDIAQHPPVRMITGYKTRYGAHDSKNRIHNIKLLAAALDNYIILSGETFSLLNALGDFSSERGLKEAYVIIRGELVPQYGGGACQIATTLYNAALLADLDVKERQNHALYVYIYPLGRDAAIYSGGRDLKIENNTGYPIMLRSFSTDDDLSFWIYGTPTGKTVIFTKPKIVTEAGEVVSRESFAFDVPFRTMIVRTVSLEGETIKAEKIRSYYSNGGEGANTKIVRPEPE